MASREQLEKIANAWWYYSAELADGLVAHGQYPSTFPYLPRLLMRRADLTNADCLDLGCMEGMLQVLMHRGGAKRIVAADAVPHCTEKMATLQEVYDASWTFKETGLMYDLSHKFGADESFDFVNLSGVLYHVFSPMHTIASVRPLVKQNGLFLVSTNVINEVSDIMQFNTAGRQEAESNTFWYPSISLLEYFLRYFNFAPIDCVFVPIESKCIPGYGNISIVCRAVGQAQALAEDDNWGKDSIRHSWEYLSLSKQRYGSQTPDSTIGYAVPPALQDQVNRTGSINLYQAVNELGCQVDGTTSNIQDTYLLRLNDKN